MKIAPSLTHLTSYWPIGVLLALITAFTGALGDNMVRKAFTQRNALSKMNERSTSLLKNPLWVGGMFLTTVVDVTLTMIALMLAPSTAVTPFAGAHIGFSVLLSRIWLKETISYLEYCGSVVVVGGIMCVIAFVGKEQTVLSLEDISPALSRPESISYFSCLAGVTAVFVLFSLKCVTRKSPWGASAIRCLAMAGSSGLFGGLSNVTGKFMALVIYSFYQEAFNTLLQPIAYLTTLSVTFSALSQLYFLNQGLRLFEAVYIVPTINSFLISSSVIGGVLVFEEEPTSIVGFTLGVLTILVGVLLLAYGRYRRTTTSRPTRSEKLRTYSFFSFPSMDLSQLDEEDPSPSFRSPSASSVLRGQTSPVGSAFIGAVVEQGEEGGGSSQ